MRALVLLLLTGCAITVGAPYGEQFPPEPRTRWLSWRASEEGRNLQEQIDWDERLAQGQRPRFDLRDDRLARRANGIYARLCANCHGDPGAEPKLKVAPKLGGRGYRMGMLMGGDKMARGVFKTLSEGRGAMPSFAGQLTNEQLWLMVEYLRSF